MVPSSFSVTTTFTGSSLNPGAEPSSAPSGRGSLSGWAEARVPVCTLPSTTSSSKVTLPVKPLSVATVTEPSSNRPAVALSSSARTVATLAASSASSSAI